MRILLIAPAYAPHSSPRAYRWSGVVAEWSCSGHEVDVVCMPQPQAPALEREGGVTIHRAGSSIGAALRQRFASEAVHVGAGSGATPGIHRVRGVLRTSARWLHNATWRRLYWPDSNCLWYPAARRTAWRLLRTGNHDAIVSVSLPFVGHLVGEACSRARPELPWLVDIGDPFALMEATPVNNLALYRSLNRSVEARVLRRAHRIALTNEAVRELYAAEFGIPRERIAVIPPMAGLGAAVPSRRGGAQNGDEDGRIVLSYFGLLFRGIREPRPLLELLRGALRTDPALARRLELRFYGDVSACASGFEHFPDLSGKLRFPGYIPRAEVPAAMAETDVLVNLGNTTSYQLPSKAAEYIVSGMPILNVANIAGDAMTRLLADHPLALSVHAAEASGRPAADAFIAFVRGVRGRRLEAAEIDARAAQFRPARIAAQYLDLLTTVPQ